MKREQYLEIIRSIAQPFTAMDVIPHMSAQDLRARQIRGVQNDINRLARTGYLLHFRKGLYALKDSAP